ncbi:hypothetical protein SUGI_0330990 [Cryptomeria japonica]|uniref:uncharacterized protein LOC131035605 n=1 Tax=Cryptomeria japonica TaxID=3369 RepID=UPI002408A99D|nr:uncharacterized protein LOC131035605 [Cryptomeria japonica]GLJ18588.1 hypothetical protein SUGI_0330990 [Cryptomeria japonica]
MEGINRAVDFTFGSSRNKRPYPVDNSKKSIAIGYSKGCILVTNSLRKLSGPILAARRTNCVVAATFKRTSQATRWRNALRPKILKVREPDLNISDDVVREQELLSGENISQGLENKSIQGLEKQFSEGFRESLQQGSEDTGRLHVLGEEENLLEENFSENFEKESTEGFPERLDAEEKRKYEDVGRKLWDDLEKLKLQLDKDAEEWGVGTDRIFHIYENGDGEVQRVDVNDDAILRRCGIQPLAFQFAEEEAKSLANHRLNRARVVAKEIESGVFSPPRNSTVFRFVRPGESTGEKLWKGLGYVVDRVDNVYGHVPGILKFTVVGFAFVYCFWFLWMARKPAPAVRNAFEEEERKKMLMRKMKLRMEKERMERLRMERDLGEKDGRLMDGDSPSVYEDKPVREGSKVYAGNPNTSEAEQKKRIFATRTSKGKVPIDDREFDRKIEMIRRMANDVRQMEQQKASKNVNDPEDSNEAIVPDQNGSPLVSGPIDVIVTSSALLDNDKHNRKSAEVTVAKDENLNGQNSILSGMDLKAFSNSNKGETVNVTDSNATDINGALASAAGSEHKANEKELSSVNVLASSTVVDCKGTENRISNGAAIKEERSDFGSVADSGSKVDRKELGPMDDHVSAATLVDDKATANISTNGATIKEEKLDLGSVADSGGKANRKDLGPMDYKGTENGLSNGATRKEENLNLQNHMLSGESNGTEGNKDFSLREKPADVRYTDSAKECSHTYFLGHSSSKDVGEKVGAERTVHGEKPFSQSGTDKPKSLNGKHPNKPDGISVKSRIGTQRLRPRVITSVEEAHALLASKWGKTSNDRSGDIENRSTPYGSNGRIQEFDFDKQKLSSDRLMAPETESSSQDLLIANANTGTNQTELTAGGKLDKVNFEKLRPAFKIVEVHQKDKPTDTKVGDASETDDLQIEHENESDEEENNMAPEEVDDFKWMQDDVLRNIVFKVKSNEEAGKEPFDGLDSKEEDLFFQGIEKTIERKGEMVNNWVADKVENLDYGKDGIAYDDPPEVFMARWKDRDKTESSPFLDKLKEDREKFMKTKTESSSKLYHSGNPEAESSSKSGKSTSISMSSASPSTNSTCGANDKVCTSFNDSSSGAKTIISSSGESSKFVKDLKTESWQHTKKWSRALQEKYNAEKDPKIKEVIKEMGQDLDRWITEEEVEKISLVLKNFSEEELNNMKRIKERITNENEKFGREAMLSKYRGYKPKKKDHLWWIDLPYVLCIELYRNKDGELVRGFYSLEMVPDLEPRAKYRHVIAFEDRGDAKNFCYILRSSLENASARVIPRTSKDLYREAQSEGYKVTVIKKARIQLYFDKPLEEVEDMMAEIGNDIYYDKILEDNVIDMDSVIENGFGY